MKRFAISDLVSYLRNAVAVAEKDLAGEDWLVEDLAYAALSDEELQLYLQVAATRDFSEYPLDKIPEEAIYPITLLARRDLYFYLATCAAPLYNLQADGASLSRTQRFEHYMALIQQLDIEFADWENNGGTSGTNGTLTSYPVHLSNRYYTRYNQRTSALPAVVLYLDEIGSDYVEVSWNPKFHTTNFQSYKVYCSSDGDVFDNYKFQDKAKVSSTAVLIAHIKNIWQRNCRIKGLNPETQYSVGVVVTANGGRKGYDLDTFTTEALVVDDDETEGDDSGDT